jgi:RNA polymerase sigma-70 factor (ECF subfamily)
MKGMEVSEFEQMYARHAPAISAFALRRTRDEQAAEEVVSETFLIAWRRSNELQGDPLPWLYGVARRVLAGQARTRRRDPVELNVDVAAPEDRSLERAELISAVLRLPELERDALLLTVWEGLDQRACATALGCSRVAVALRLRRARARLRTTAPTAPSSRSSHPPIPREAP